MVNIESKTQRKERPADRRPKISPRAVLAPEFLRQAIPLRAAWVGTLKDKRHISSAIRHLTRVLPAPSSVDNSSPPALPTVGNSSHLQLQELEELLGSVGEDFEPSNFEREFEIVRVPASAPRTKAQACAASKIWPLNFHPDPYVERTLSGSCFTPEDLGTIDRCLGLCIEAARQEARGNEDCTGSAIIFDPRRGKIVAIAASRIDLHPMWHAAILGVDLVARLQGGGAYDLVGESVGNRKRKYTGSRPEIRLPVAFPAGLLELLRREGDSTSGCEVGETGSRSEIQLPVGLPELARRGEASTSGCEIEETGSRPEIRLPVAFPAGLPALERRERDSTSGCEVEETGSRPEIQVPVGLPELAKRKESSTSGCEVEETGSRAEVSLPAALPAGLPELARREESSTSGCNIEGEERGKNGSSEYLCTNYWAFLLREPCPLCAMALVHSRVSDIFWGAENERRGVLGSRALLHAVPGLNHRYRVWRGVREEECRRLCGEIIIRR